MKETGVHKNNGHNGHNGQYERFFSLLKKQRKKLRYHKRKKILMFLVYIFVPGKGAQSTFKLLSKTREKKAS